MSSDTGHRRVSACRVCGATALWTFLSLGDTPLANALIRPEDSAGQESRYPLVVARCRSCGLVQLTVTVAPQVLFGPSYAYFTSASSPMVEHFDRYAADLVSRFGPAGLVVEIGSNDGALLGSLARRGARVLGVEPAANMAGAANAKGLETLNAFFGEDTARSIAQERGRAGVVIANNVLAHIDDLPQVARALDMLLAPDGVFVAEFPYLADLLQHVEYDTIYHEHLSYLSLRPLRSLFENAGLRIVDVERQPVHGGSLRLFVARRGDPSPAVRALEAAESRDGLDDEARYERFAQDVAASRQALRTLLEDARSRGRRVAAIGATAKGNTLLNYCGLTTTDIAYIADSTPAKQGMLTPGAHIPIRPESALRLDPPDLTLLLAWNYADAILAKFSDYISAGGRFIHPIPRARVIPA